MPLTENFSTSQVIGLPQRIYFTDTSTGNDGSVGERRIFLQKEDGTYLTPDGSATDYILWPLATNPFYVDILDKDYALNVTVVWWGDEQDFLMINDTDSVLINSTDKFII